MEEKKWMDVIWNKNDDFPLTKMHVMHWILEAKSHLSMSRSAYTSIMRKKHIYICKNVLIPYQNPCFIPLNLICFSSNRKWLHIFKLQKHWNFYIQNLLMQWKLWIIHVASQAV